VKGQNREDALTARLSVITLITTVPGDQRALKPEGNFGKGMMSRIRGGPSLRYFHPDSNTLTR
jgi:hypothetical protein